MYLKTLYHHWKCFPYKSTTGICMILPKFSFLNYLVYINEKWNFLGFEIRGVVNLNTVIKYKVGNLDLFQSLSSLLQWTRNHIHIFFSWRYFEENMKKKL